MKTEDHNTTTTDEVGKYCMYSFLYRSLLINHSIGFLSQLLSRPMWLAHTGTRQPSSH